MKPGPGRGLHRVPVRERWAADPRGSAVGPPWGRSGGDDGCPRLQRGCRGCEDLGSRAEAALVGSLQGFGAFTLGTTTSHPGAGAAWLLSGGLSPTRRCLSWGGGTPASARRLGRARPCSGPGRLTGSAARLAIAPLSWAPRGSPSAPSGSRPPPAGPGTQDHDPRAGHHLRRRWSGPSVPDCKLPGGTGLPDGSP